MLLANLIRRDYTDRFYILISAALYGLITVAGKYFSDRGLSLYEISLLILFIPLPICPLLILNRKYRIPTELLGFFFVFGLIGAALQVTQFAGIVLGVPVAVVALLLYSQPVWTTILGKWLLQEKITKRKVTSSAVALSGVIVLVDPFSSGLNFSLPGLASAVLAGLFLSLWVIWGRKSSLRNQHYITTVFGYTSFSALCLLLAYPFLVSLPVGGDHLRLDFINYLENGWAVAAFSVFAGILPASLAFCGMRTVEASTAGVLLLLEPVSAAVLAYLLFDQALTSNIWLGGGLILLANYILLKAGAAQTAS